MTKRCQPQALPGIGADDIVALWDSLRTDDPRLQQRWDTEYWPNALAIAPYLSIDDRAQLFAPLWGKEPALTACYRRLAYRLEQLEGAASVLAPLSLLTDENQQPSYGILTPANLEETDDKVQLKLDNGVITMPVAELRLLVAELLIPLQSPRPIAALRRPIIWTCLPIGQTTRACSRPRASRCYNAIATNRPCKR